MSERSKRGDGMGQSADPILYSFRRCPYAIRARLALAISGTPCELREVNLRAKPAHLLAMSPKATVPVLVLPNGQVIDESLSIMRWALKNSDPEAWLERDDSALIAVNDGPFKRALDAYKYSDGHGANPLSHRERGLAFLRKIEARLSFNRQLGGSRRGLTDAAVLPFVRQFAAAGQEWFNAQALPHLQTWLHDHLDSELFRLSMLRVAVWSPGNSPVVFPPTEERL